MGIANPIGESFVSVTPFHSCGLTNQINGFHVVLLETSELTATRWSKLILFFIEPAKPNQFATHTFVASASFPTCCNAS